MASRGVNRAIIIGNLGQEPEVREANGTQVCNFSVATSSTWKDKSGEIQEATEWHRIVVWGKLAEICGKYLTKGSKVYIEGRLQTRKWQAQDGTDRYSTEIVCNDMQMLDRASNDSQPQPQQGQQRSSKPRQAQPATQKPESAYPAFDDDIPF